MPRPKSEADWQAELDQANKTIYDLRVALLALEGAAILAMSGDDRTLTALLSDRGSGEGGHSTPRPGVSSRPSDDPRPTLPWEDEGRKRLLKRARRVAQERRVYAFPPFNELDELTKDQKMIVALLQLIAEDETKLRRVLREAAALDEEGGDYSAEEAASAWYHVAKEYGLKAYQ